MTNQNATFFSAEPVSTTSFMIEAKEEISEFVESEDGIIINLFWSNEEGWTSFFLADSFTKEEYFEFNLPEGGIWVEVSKVFNLVASDDTFLITEISKIKRNPVVYPDSFDDETNFRVI